MALGGATPTPPPFPTTSSKHSGASAFVLGNKTKSANPPNFSEFLPKKRPISSNLPRSSKFSSKFFRFLPIFQDIARFSSKFFQSSKILQDFLPNSFNFFRILPNSCKILQDLRRFPFSQNVVPLWYKYRTILLFLAKKRKDHAWSLRCGSVTLALERRKRYFVRVFSCKANG